MLSLIDIKKAIVDKLKTLGIKVIASEVKSGFEKPAFFVRITPLSHNTCCDMSKRLITVNIHYFSNDKTDIDNLKMNDLLDKTFINYLSVGDRILTLYEKRSEIDEILQFKFELRYTEEVYRDTKEVYDLIDDMQFNIN